MRKEWSDRDVQALRRLLAIYGPARLVRCTGELAHEIARVYDDQNPAHAARWCRVGNLLDAHAQRQALHDVQGEGNDAAGERLANEARQAMQQKGAAR